MGRAVGFSLQVLGTDKTIKEIEAVEKRLLLFGEKIKAANAKANQPSTTTGSGSSGSGNKKDIPSIQDKQAYIDYAREIEKTRLEKKRLTDQAKLEAQEFDNVKNNIPTDSIIGMRLQIKQLNFEWDKLNRTQREGVEGKAILSKLQPIFKDLQAGEEATGRFQRNVGNYRENVARLIPVLEHLGAVGLKTDASLAAAFREDNKKQVKELQLQVEGLGKEYLELRSDIIAAAAAKQEAAAAEARANASAIEAEKSKSAVIKAEAKANAAIAKSASDAAIAAEAKSALAKSKLNELTIAIEKLNTASTNLKSANTSFDLFKGKLLSISSLVTGGLIGGGILGLLGGLKAIGTSAIREFEEAEIALVKVDTLVKKTGQSTGFATAQLKQMADELGKANNIDNDKILNSVTAQLLVFDKITGQTFAKAQKLAIDIGKTFEGGLEGASSVIGKILTFPESSTKLLKQFGIDLSKQEEKRIKQLVEQNKLQEAQLILVEKLEKFSGQGIAQAATELGRFKALSVEFNEALEDIGRTLAKIGVGFIDFAVDVIQGTAALSDGAKIVRKSQIELGNSIQSDNSFIQTNIALLKDANVQGKFRQEIIDKLVAKYPELISKSDLQNASIKSLTEIEKELTKATTAESLKRVAAKENELLVSKRIEIENEIAVRKQKQSKLVPGSFGFNTQGEFIKRLQEQLADVLPEIEKSSETLSKAANIKVSVNLSFDNIKTQLQVAIEDVKKALSDSKTFKGNIPGLQKQLDALISIDSTVTQNSTQVSLNAIRNFVQQTQTLILGATKDTTSVITEAQKAAAKKAKDELDAQLKRIQDLKDKYQQTQNNLLSDEFEKQRRQAEQAFAIIERNAKEVIDKLEKANKAKGVTGKQVSKNNEEIEAQRAIIEIEGKVREDAIRKANEGQQKAVEEGIVSLRQQRDELEKTILETNKLVVDSEVEDIKFDQGQELRPIKLKFDADTQNLDEQLAKGLISQEQYNEQKESLELEASNKEYEILVNGKQRILDAYEAQYASSLSLLKANHKQRIHEIEEARKNELAKIDEQLNTGQLGTGTDAIALAANKKAQVVKNSNAEIEKADKELFTEQTKLQNDLVTNQQSVSDQIVAIKKTADQQEIDSEKSKQDKLKELRQLAADKGFELAQSISDTLFEIENTRAEERFNNDKTNLEKEYANRLELAKGNAGETARIEREKNQALKKLEQDEQKRRKTAAVNQAIIDGLLAIAKTFAAFGFTPAAFIAAAAQAITTGILISKIRSTPAGAKGGWTQDITGAKGGRAPKDQTGHSPAGDIATHMDEYLSPPEQTKKHSWLYDYMEEDRKALLSGQGSTLEKRLKERYKAIGVEINKRATVPMAIMPKPIVVKINANPVLNINANFSDEQMEYFTEMISNKLSQRTGKAVYDGTVKANENELVNELRQQSMLARKGI